MHYTRFEAAMVRPAPWSRARAAFVLEVAVRNGIGESQLSAIGRSMVIGRSTALGADDTEDRFEILFHHVAIGLLQERMDVESLVDYVDAVGSKLDAARRRGVALETRIPLARAFTSALVCCWTRSRGELIRHFRDLSRSRVTLADALAQFEEAARAPALRAEALIRGAKLLFDTNRRPDALAWIERVPDHSDPLLGYAHNWTHARLLDVDRPADAAAAYRRALAFAPKSQEAAIGLAAALLRAGHAEESAKAAADARAMHVVNSPAEVATRDLGLRMSTFHRGDGRFVQQWLAEVRRLRR
jgi:tetratricopeptide (TPR) repeat protein